MASSQSSEFDDDLVAGVLADILAGVLAAFRARCQPHRWYPCCSRSLSLPSSLVSSPSSLQLQELISALITVILAVIPHRSDLNANLITGILADISQSSRLHASLTTAAVADISAAARARCRAHHDLLADISAASRSSSPPSSWTPSCNPCRHRRRHRCCAQLTAHRCSFCLPSTGAPRSSLSPR